MRENRTSGSEGGEPVKSRLPYPYQPCASMWIGIFSTSTISALPCLASFLELQDVALLGSETSGRVWISCFPFGFSKRIDSLRDRISRLMTALYVILGASGSGRREIIVELIRSHLPGGSATLYLSEAEALSPHDDYLRTSKDTAVVPWRDGGDGQIASDPPAGEFESVFFLLDGRRNPVDQMEAIKPWAQEYGLRLARIMTVVHCRLLYENAALMKWFDACIHFSDCVLLNMRSGLPNRWIKELQGHYTHRRYPCLFELIKKGRMSNPDRILFPEARRITHYLDDLEPSGDYGEILIEGDLPKEGDDQSGSPQDDPYLCRDSRGHRQVRLPEIRKYLPCITHSVEPTASSVSTERG